MTFEREWDCEDFEICPVRFGDKKSIPLIQLLRKHPKGLGFNEMRDLLTHCMAPGTLKVKLDDLLETGYVRFEPENWRRGQKRAYILTDTYIFDMTCHKCPYSKLSDLRKLMRNQPYIQMNVNGQYSVLPMFPSQGDKLASAIMAILFPDEEGET